MEADPRSDIDGWDTASKLVILFNFGLGAAMAIGDVAVDGIGDVTAVDMRAMAARGEVPKLVGTLKWAGSTFEAAVALRAVPATDTLAGVGGGDKAVRIKTEDMGDIFVSAHGAEPHATAAAAMKDLESILEASVR